MRGPKMASPAADGADRAQDLGLVGALEQVAARAGPHRGEDRVVVLEHRQHQHADVRARRPTMRRVASMPLSSGICRSISDHVGLQLARPARPPRAPSAASPTTSTSPAAASRSMRSPRRNTGWSSATQDARRAPRHAHLRTVVDGQAGRGTTRAARRPRRRRAGVPPSSAARSRIETRPTPAGAPAAMPRAVVASTTSSSAPLRGQPHRRSACASAWRATLVSASCAMR